MDAAEFASIRARLGLSVRALSQTIGVEPSTVSRWERGERQIPSDTADTIRALIPPTHTQEQTTMRDTTLAVDLRCGDAVEIAHLSTDPVYGGAPDRAVLVRGGMWTGRIDGGAIVAPADLPAGAILYPAIGRAALTPVGQAIYDAALTAGYPIVSPGAPNDPNRRPEDDHVYGSPYPRG